MYVRELPPAKQKQLLVLLIDLSDRYAVNTRDMQRTYASSFCPAADGGLPSPKIGN